MSIFHVKKFCYLNLYKLKHNFVNVLHIHFKQKSLNFVSQRQGIANYYNNLTCYITGDQPKQKIESSMRERHGILRLTITSRSQIVTGGTIGWWRRFKATELLPWMTSNFPVIRTHIGRPLLTRVKAEYPETMETIEGTFSYRSRAR